MDCLNNKLQLLTYYTNFSARVLIKVTPTQCLRVCAHLSAECVCVRMCVCVCARLLWEGDSGNWHRYCTLSMCVYVYAVGAETLVLYVPNTVESYLPSTLSSNVCHTVPARCLLASPRTLSLLLSLRSICALVAVDSTSDEGRLEERKRERKNIIRFMFMYEL